MKRTALEVDVTRKMISQW